MKKLMIAFVAVAVAAVTQAASIDWSIAQNQWTLNNGTKAAADFAVYLIDGATSLDTIKAAIDSTTGAFNAEQTWVYGSSKTTGSKGKVAEVTTESGSLARGTSYDFSVLMIDTSVANSPYYMVSGISSGTPYDSTAGDEQASIIFGSDQFGTGALTYNSTTAANGWAAVPEPTSGLLLLIGMTGLALKRKRV